MKQPPLVEIVDGLSELFGTNMIDGFTELTGHDSNVDGVIDAQDGVFSQLKVWQDLANDANYSNLFERRAA